MNDVAVVIADEDDCDDDGETLVTTTTTTTTRELQLSPGCSCFVVTLYWTKQNYCYYY
jgi:hypothetical protein